MQTSKLRTPRGVKGRSVGKRVRSRRRRPTVVHTVVDNPHAHSGKRVRRPIEANEKPKAAERRNRKPAVAAVEIKPRAVRTFTAEELQARSERRRQRHRQRKLRALQELLAEMNLEVVPKKEAS